MLRRVITLLAGSLPCSSSRSFQVRRGGRVAEGARLESVFTLTGNVGSNPTLSANFLPVGYSTDVPTLNALQPFD